jgi:hypothetical protein
MTSEKTIINIVVQAFITILSLMTQDEDNAFTML